MIRFNVPYYRQFIEKKKKINVDYDFQKYFGENVDFS